MAYFKSCYISKPILAGICHLYRQHTNFSRFHKLLPSPLGSRQIHLFRPKPYVPLTNQVDATILETEFLSVFPELVAELTEDGQKFCSNPHVQKTKAWFSRVLSYNVPFGKRTRGLSVAWAYRHCATPVDADGIYLSYILGWCLEMLQAYILVVDDIMDNSDLRRGQPSWHRVDGIGNLAMNDGCYLYSAIFVLLKKYFGHKPFYPLLLELIHEVNHKTIVGQCLDSRTSLEKKFETYDMELYDTILEHKAGFYVTYLPMKLGMILARVPTAIITDHKLREVMLEIGKLYQFQNDYNDCFGNEGTMGKPGNDIQNGKCTWNFITARQKCSPAQETVLLKNYGENDPTKANAVKELYQELNLPADYKTYMQRSYERINKLIVQLPVEFPRKLFQDVLKAAQIHM